MRRPRLMQIRRFCSTRNMLKACRGAGLPDTIWGRSGGPARILRKHKRYSTLHRLLSTKRRCLRSWRSLSSRWLRKWSVGDRVFLGEKLRILNWSKLQWLNSIPRPLFQDSPSNHLRRPDVKRLLWLLPTKYKRTRKKRRRTKKRPKALMLS